MAEFTGVSVLAASRERLAEPQEAPLRALCTPAENALCTPAENAAPVSPRLLTSAPLGFLPRTQWSRARSLHMPTGLRGGCPSWCPAPEPRTWVQGADPVPPRPHTSTQRRRPAPDRRHPRAPRGLSAEVPPHLRPSSGPGVLAPGVSVSFLGVKVAGTVAEHPRGSAAPRNRGSPC